MIRMMKRNLIVAAAAASALSAGGFAARLAAESASAPQEPAATTSGVAISEAAPPEALRVVDEKEINLAAAFPKLPAAQSRTFRARKLYLAPGARTPEVDGARAPSIFFVTKGAVIEHRSDQAAQVEHGLRSAGSISKGVTHWVENTGAEPAELLVMDILPSSAE